MSNALEQYSYVDWDHDASVVTKGAKFDDVRPLLEVVWEQREETPTREPAPTIEK